MGYRKRKLQIIKKLFDSGILDLAKNKLLDKGKIVTDKKEAGEKEFAENLRKSLEDLGPVFIKFGQLLSTRRDILPKYLVKELEKLQDDVSPIEYCEIEETIYQEFGKKIEEIFDEFDPVALASGSIAQTHKATINISGKKEKVCVKVQRRGLRELVDVDTKIMKEISKNFFDRFFDNSSFDLDSIIDEFRLSLFKEIDFEIEKENLKRFEKIIKTDKHVLTPRVYDAYSTKKVLTMEFIGGRSIRKIKFLTNQESIDIANKLIYSYVNQMFTHGFFHADPHPGNIFINDDGKIYLLDFGIVGKLSENYRYQIMKIFIGAAFNEVKIITDAVIGMGLLKFDNTQIPDFEKRIQEILDKYLALSLHQMKISDLIEDFFKLLKDFEIKVPSDLTNFGKTVFSLEGLIEKLAKKKSFVELAFPIAKKLIFKILNPKTVVTRLRPRIYDIITLLKEFPTQSLSMIRQLSSGDFALVIKKDQKDFEREDKNSKKLSFSIVFLALAIVLSASLIAMSIYKIRIFFLEKLLIILIISTIFSMLVMAFKILRK